LVRFRDSHKDKWFAVDNYVQHMCDHLRSKVGNVVRRMGVQAFHSNATDTLRDIVLGTKDKDGNRSPWFCDDDGLEIYDVEVTNVTIKDIKINNLLTSAKQEALAEQIELERQNQKLALTKGVEEAKRNIMLETDKSLALRDELQAKSAARADNNDLEEARREALIKEAKKQGERTAAEVEAETEAIERESARLNKELEKLFAEADLDRAVRKLAAEADSTEKRLKAVQPGLVEALIAASTTSVLKDVVPQMGALAFTNNQDLETTLNTMVKGTAAEDLIKNLKNLSHRPQNNGPIPTA
jgi:major vault protein